MNGRMYVVMRLYGELREIAADNWGIVAVETELLKAELAYVDAVAAEREDKVIVLYSCDPVQGARLVQSYVPQSGGVRARMWLATMPEVYAGKGLRRALSGQWTTPQQDQEIEALVAPSQE